MSPARRPPRPPSRRRLLRVAALLLVGLLLAGAPAMAYIVFLKDGSQITTKEKPRVEGDTAYLVLPNGTEASYKASEIDFEKTEKVNVVDYGTARLLESMDKPNPAPKPLPEEEGLSFGEYISGRSLALPQVRKRQVAEREEDLPTTKAGFVDFMALRREPYPDTAVTSEVLGYLRGQGLSGVRIFQGTAADRPLLEIVATSEASVFKALKDSANGLVQIHERFPKQVAAFELVVMTESQARAGQFVLTPERATQLVTGKISASSFFLRYVEF